MWNVSADLLEALPPEQLHAAGNMVAAFEAIASRIVARLEERSTGDAEPGIVRKLGDQKPQVTGVEGHVSVEVADDVEIEGLDASVAGAERRDLGGEVTTVVAVVHE